MLQHTLRLCSPATSASLLVLHFLGERRGHHTAVDLAMSRMTAGVPRSDQSFLMSLLRSLEGDYVQPRVLLDPYRKGTWGGFECFVEEMFL